MIQILMKKAFPGNHYIKDKNSLLTLWVVGFLEAVGSSQRGKTASK
jgi:hypothetical protein